MRNQKGPGSVSLNGLVYLLAGPCRAWHAFELGDIKLVVRRNNGF